VTEEALDLYHFVSLTQEWQIAACGEVTHDVAANRLVVPICHVATFGVFGAGSGTVYLPMVEQN
jgi:hypothetical protein